MQVAGGAGMVAVGGGMRLADQQLEPELLLGYVPSRFSGQPLAIFTFKATYLPLRHTLGEQWRASAGAGVNVTYTAGPTLRNSQDPNTYRRGYYWFSSKIRTGLFLAPRLAYAALPPLSATFRWAAYAELGTSDLYLVSRISNKGAPSFAELLTLGIGSKASW